MLIKAQADIVANCARIKDHLNNICARVGVATEKIIVVAVTKTLLPQTVERALKSGIMEIGENRIQEAETKVSVIHKFNAKIHLIGHLQSNKVKKAVGLFDMIQSVDSIKIASAISTEMEIADKKKEVLLQVNCSQEESKSGFDPGSLEDAVGEISLLPGLAIRGLMTIGRLTDDRRLIRKDFRQTRKLFDRMASIYPIVDMRFLSMGMSADYEIALEEGANMLRLGSALFGPREN